MRISVVVGTRPEIIKMAPIIRECEKQNIDFFVLHTGQHYSYNMDQVFFEQLQLPSPKYNLEVGSASHGKQTANLLAGIEKILLKEKPDVVLVEGDTNTVLAGALAASKLHIPVGHVEAGLRSYDKRMPEEINRILCDHCSDFLFAPTEQSKQTLLSEGISTEHIFVTGNTIVDAVFQHRDLLSDQKNILHNFGLSEKKYFLVTTHRQENVDDYHRFKNILEGLQHVHDRFELPVIYPVHPRSKKNLEDFHLPTDGIKLIDPVDYLQFLTLQQHSHAVLTDSGGVQEETCILGVPCVTLRDNTERPETLEVGSNILAGIRPDQIVDCVTTMTSERKKWKNPYGAGDAGKKIVSILRDT